MQHLRGLSSEHVQNVNTSSLLQSSTCLDPARRAQVLRRQRKGRPGLLLVPATTQLVSFARLGNVLNTSLALLTAWAR